jgi:hypothetical protein
MSLFEASQTPFVSAVQQIADSCGASADTEMTTRAGISLNSAIRHFNNRYKWNWLLTEAAPIVVVAPFGVAGVTASASVASAAAPAAHGIKTDDFISGLCWPMGTRATATAASGFGVNALATGFATTATMPVTATRDMYDLPSDYKAVYTCRLLSSNTPLRYVQRRGVDRGNVSEQAMQDTYGYDLLMVGSKGKIRLLTPPAGADVLQVRYHRNMATGSASASTTTLDIPDNYEPYLMAWAKWHFLTDKGEERKMQATTWLSLAEDGLKTMLKDQTNIPDEELGFTPGHMQAGRISENSVVGVSWDY